MDHPYATPFDRICSFAWALFRRIFGGKTPHHPTSDGAAQPLVDLPSLHEQAAYYEAESIRMGTRYRFGFLMNFTLGVVAVTLAAIPFALDEVVAHHFGRVFTVAEGGCILTILVIHVLGRENERGALAGKLLGVFGLRANQAWRRNWVENRVHAEQFRYAQLLLGFPGEPLEVDASAGTFLDRSLTRHYSTWYAQTRGAVVCRPVDSDYVGRYRNFVVGVIEQQIGYHETNAHRCENIHHRLHRVANVCFWITLGICVVHFFFHYPWLSVLAVSLPAAAAACHGILGAGEFATFAQQSEDMVRALTDAKKRLDAPGTPALAELHEQIRQLYRLVISEASGWHVALRSKDLQIG
ncbi:hypothetical protein DIE14_29170 [Burkholderia sp. Bp9017]|uniref:hypothetical protein n=1 Tax=Burkholderia TaxID=32008 RepID=UPI000F5DDB80|nr:MULTISPECIES: hypothetical protein [Burkholderia]RQZ20451.1 hypothetical protein DIE14_29170 [Burkholderia sp. Bp9017]